jgi:hypothetical protein
MKEIAEGKEGEIEGVARILRHEVLPGDAEHLHVDEPLLERREGAGSIHETACIVEAVAGRGIAGNGRHPCTRQEEAERKDMT